MAKIPPTTKTPAEIDAAFDAVFKNLRPVGRPATLAERLAPYRKAIGKQRQRGFSWNEIAKGMANPDIGVTISGAALAQAFGKAATPAPTPGPSANLKQRLILDPLTGLPVTPTPRPTQG